MDRENGSRFRFRFAIPYSIGRLRARKGRFRGLLIRGERKGTNYLGLLHLACAMIALRHTM